MWKDPFSSSLVSVFLATSSEQWVVTSWWPREEEHELHPCLKKYVSKASGWTIKTPQKQEKSLDLVIRSSNNAKTRWRNPHGFTSWFLQKYIFTPFTIWLVSKTYWLVIDSCYPTFSAPSRPRLLPPPAPPEASVSAGQRPPVGLQRLPRACRRRLPREEAGGRQPRPEEAV